MLTRTYHVRTGHPTPCFPCQMATGMMTLNIDRIKR